MEQVACTPNKGIQTLDLKLEVFLVTARTYFATAVKAKSTLRPILALVSMKGSPYSCKQLLLARGHPGGGQPRPYSPRGHPSSHPPCPDSP